MDYSLDDLLSSQTFEC